MLEFKEQKYLYYTGYALILLLVHFIQYTPGFMIPIRGILPQPVLIFIIYIAMTKGSAVGGVIGIAAGILTDLNVVNGSGFHAIAYFLTGMLCGILAENFVQTNFLSVCTFTALFSFLNITADWFSKTFHSLSASLYFKFFIPTMIYTLVLSIPLYFLLNLVLGRKPKVRLKRILPSKEELKSKTKKENPYDPKELEKNIKKSAAK